MFRTATYRFLCLGCGMAKLSDQASEGYLMSIDDLSGCTTSTFFTKLTKNSSRTLKLNITIPQCLTQRSYTCLTWVALMRRKYMEMNRHVTYANKVTQDIKWPILTTHPSPLSFWSTLSPPLLSFIADNMRIKHSHQP